MTAPANRLKPSSAKRVAAYRQRMRDAGLVPKTIWVPDTENPTVREDIERACKAIAANVESEQDIMNWIDAVTADLDLGPPYPFPDKA